MKKTILILSLAVLLSACGTKTANVPRLDCPPPLVLPKLTEGQDTAFFEWDQDVYATMVRREELLLQRIDTMCGIIESTHQE